MHQRIIGPVADSFIMFIFKISRGIIYPLGTQQVSTRGFNSNISLTIFDA